MDFRDKEYRVFKMFQNDWALVTAGDKKQFNSCTVAWGSLGNIWGDAGHPRSTVTVYIHPDRCTSKFLLENEVFTVSFFPREYKKALVYMGTHSGRDGNKAQDAGLTPIAVGESVCYQEAELTFVCRKLYQHQFAKEDLAPEIQASYAENPEAYPDGNGGWQPHLVFVGEVLECIDHKE